MSTSIIKEYHDKTKDEKTEDRNNQHSSEVDKKRYLTSGNR